MSNLKGMMPLEQFKQLCGLTEITFLKGKGRQFVGTPMGTLFVSAKFDINKPKYVTVCHGLEGREELNGTLWLVNSEGLAEGITL